MQLTANNQQKPRWTPEDETESALSVVKHACSVTCVSEDVRLDIRMVNQVAYFMLRMIFFKYIFYIFCLYIFDVLQSTVTSFVIDLMSIPKLTYFWVILTQGNKENLSKKNTKIW